MGAEPLPKVGNCRVLSTDNRVHCLVFGLRDLRLWAAEISEEQPLDRAIELFQRDCQAEADRVGIPLEQLTTSPMQLSEPQAGRDGRTVQYLYAKVENVDQRKAL